MTHPIPTRPMRFLLLTALAVVLISRPGAAAAADGVQITEKPDRLTVEINGKLFTEYFYKDVPRPYCYPVLGPGDALMVRNWPLKTVPDEEHDHPHHRSFWYAHGLMNGRDFWTEQKDFGKIVHAKFVEIRSGKDSGVIVSSNRWVAADSKLICTDERSLRVFAPASDAERMFDFQITLYPADGDLVLGDTKEGTMALRLAETMRLKGKTGKGHIVNSRGLCDDATWGKRAEWCDYYGPVDGKTVGVAIFDHPKNPRFPTWWHVRDYGLFAANPTGQHEFEKLRDKQAGDLKVPAGSSVTFRYRFYFHTGDDKQGQVKEHYDAFVK